MTSSSSSAHADQLQLTKLQSANHQKSITAPLSTATASVHILTFTLN